ncbi:hypothetical protein [Solirubrum puertoriconensis]|nr:hypothetical protein [Solirubrum puertoriconensis]
MSLLLMCCGRVALPSEAEVSQEMCSCYQAQKGGDIDARMKPCLEVLNARLAETAQLQSQPDTVALQTFLYQVLSDMVLSCDAFGAELSSMYDNFYPPDTSAANRASIQALARELSATSTPDSTKKLLHKLITKSMEARLFEQGLQYCARLKEVDPNEVAAYFASGYAYNQQGKYDLAAGEIEKAISLDKETHMEIFLALIKRHQETSQSKP